MLSPQALIRGIVSRALPSYNPDSSNNDVAVRQGAYGEIYTQPLVRKAHNLADEGSYWVANNGTTGITPPLGVAFSSTVAALIAYNNDPFGRRMYLDTLTLTNIVAVTCTTGTANTPCYFGMTIDNGNRLSSGGTSLSVVNPNMAYSAAAPGVTVTFGALTATNPSSAARTIIGQRMWRGEASASAITVVGDTLLVNFGSVEGAQMGSPVYTGPCTLPEPAPPVIIGPGQSFVLSMWWPNFTPAGGASGFLPELGFWMR